MRGPLDPACCGGRRPLGSDDLVGPAVTSAMTASFTARPAVAGGAPPACITSPISAFRISADAALRGAISAYFCVVLFARMTALGGHAMSRARCETGSMVPKPLPHSVGAARSCARALQSVESRLQLLRERKVTGSSPMRFGTGFAAGGAVVMALRFGDEAVRQLHALRSDLGALHAAVACNARGGRRFLAPSADRRALFATSG